MRRFQTAQLIPACQILWDVWFDWADQYAEWEDGKLSGTVVSYL